MSKGISTCTYCGTRMAMVFRGAQSHALACNSCGANLDAPAKAKKTKADRPDRIAQASQMASGVMAAASAVVDKRRQRRDDTHSPKKRKGFVGKLFDEAVDLIFD